MMQQIETMQKKIENGTSFSHAFVVQTSTTIEQGGKLTATSGHYFTIVLKHKKNGQRLYFTADSIKGKDRSLKDNFVNTVIKAIEGDISQKNIQQIKLPIKNIDTLL